jgi:phage tail tape-measure protein
MKPFLSLLAVLVLISSSCATVDRTAAYTVCSEKGFTSSECQMARMAEQAAVSSAQTKNTVVGGAGGGLGGAAVGAGIGCAASGPFCPGGAIVGGLIGLVIGGLGGAAVGSAVEPAPTVVPGSVPPPSPASLTPTSTAVSANP